MENAHLPLELVLECLSYLPLTWRLALCWEVWQLVQARVERKVAELRGLVRGRRETRKNRERLLMQPLRCPVLRFVGHEGIPEDVVLSIGKVLKGGIISNYGYRLITKIGKVEGELLSGFSRLYSSNKQWRAIRRMERAITDFLSSRAYFSRHALDYQVVMVDTALSSLVPPIASRITRRSYPVFTLSSFLYTLILWLYRSGYLTRRLTLGSRVFSEPLPSLLRPLLNHEHERWTHVRAIDEILQERRSGKTSIPSQGYSSKEDQMLSLSHAPTSIREALISIIVPHVRLMNLSELYGDVSPITNPALYLETEARHKTLLKGQTIQHHLDIDSIQELRKKLRCDIHLTEYLHGESWRNKE